MKTLQRHIPRASADVMARHHQSQCPAVSAPRPRRAFSLVEVLLAIFILGVGVISIATLFPAGIAQQRQSVDEIIGPTIAENAMAILRAKLKPSDFGIFRDTAGNPTLDPVFPTIVGDWAWRRPGVFTAQTNLDPTAPNPVIVPAGSIGIFSQVQSLGFTGVNSEVPWSITTYPGGPPHIIITQRERYYPAFSGYSNNPDVPAPQYVWDCMFRRYQGKILVAIFVYRVTNSGGVERPYSLEANPANPTGGSPNPTTLPVWLDLSAAGYEHWLAGYGTAAKPIKGLASGRYNPDDQTQCWMEPKQWLLDVNNNIYRVVGRTQDNEESASPGQMWVELSREVPALPNIPSTYRRVTVGNPPPKWLTTHVVTDIWYMPLRDIAGRTLTPVYLTVKEL